MSNSLDSSVELLSLSFLSVFFVGDDIRSKRSLWCIDTSSNHAFMCRVHRESCDSVVTVKFV